MSLTLANSVCNSIAHQRRAVLLCVLLGAVAGPASGAHDIGALGRLTPAGGIIEIHGLLTDRVAELHVQEGQQVARGDLLMVLESAVTRAAALAEAERETAAEAALAKARVAQQQAVVALHDQLLKAVETDLAGYQELAMAARTKRELQHRRSAVAEARARREVESRQLAALDAQRQLDAARTEATLRQAREALAGTRILAPSAGTVLSVRRKVGETTGEGVLLQLADLAVMEAECELFAGDLVAVRPGQEVEIVHEATGLQVAGRVAAVSRLVDNRSNLGSATVRLEDATLAAQLIGLEVQVTIRHTE